MLFKIYGIEEQHTEISVRCLVSHVQYVVAVLFKFPCRIVVNDDVIFDFRDLLIRSRGFFYSPCILLP